MEKLLIATLITAFVVLLFSRVHFHFHFTFGMQVTRKTSRKARPRPVEISGEVPPAARSIRQERDVYFNSTDTARSRAAAEITSALINLGMPQAKARKLAEKAMEQGRDFDSRIRWAMQNAA
jgi:hypothetical protein